MIELSHRKSNPKYSLPSLVCSIFVSLIRPCDGFFFFYFLFLTIKICENVLGSRPFCCWPSCLLTSPFSFHSRNSRDISKTGIIQNTLTMTKMHTRACCEYMPLLLIIISKRRRRQCISFRLFSELHLVLSHSTTYYFCSFFFCCLPSFALPLAFISLGKSPVSRKPLTNEWGSEPLSQAHVNSTALDILTSITCMCEEVKKWMHLCWCKQQQ